MAFHYSCAHSFSFSILFCMFAMVTSQLTSICYQSTCPQALSIIRSSVISAVAKEHRMGASLLRLHFHDCFVNACFLFIPTFIFLSHFQLISCLYHSNSSSLIVFKLFIQNSFIEQPSFRNYTSF